MSDKAEVFWRTHLAGTNGPLMHFLSNSLLDLASISRASKEIGSVFWGLEAGEVKSETALLEKLTVLINPPPPLDFADNWNALLDLTRDLSWTKAEGYVLVISGADNLLSLSDEVFSTLIAVLESTIRDWRDERGEFGERTGPVAFHVIFSGGKILREALLNKLKEPLCDHLAELSVNIFPAPVRLRETAAYRDAEKLASAGADTETILTFLREHGMDERDSMYSIAGLMGMTVTEARSMIYDSQTWSEIRERDEQFRKVARDVLRHFRREDN